MASQGVTKDTVIGVTLHQALGILGAMVLATLASYKYIFATFMTVAAHNAYADGQDIKDIRFSQRMLDSEIWHIESEILKPGGDTQRNRDRKRALERQKEADKEAIECIQQGGRHCLAKTEVR